MIFWFRPCGYMVSSVWIQKFFLSIKRCLRISLAFFMLGSLSIIMNFAYLLKLWHFSWKCLHAHMVFGWGFFTSFLWLFRLILKVVSAFRRYCYLQNVHSIKYMTYTQKQLTSWKILYVFWVCRILKVNAVMNWLQHRVLLFPKHWKHFPRIKVLLFILFTMFYSILLLPIGSLRFLLFKIFNWFVLKNFN